MAQAVRRRVPFFSDCVAWPDDRVAVLEYLIEHGQQISRKKFMKRVVREQIPPEWYPPPAGTPYGDAFYVLPNQPVYWYVHSAIEFVFMERPLLDIVGALALLAVEP